MARRIVHSTALVEQVAYEGNLTRDLFAVSDVGPDHVAIAPADLHPRARAPEPRVRFGCPEERGFDPDEFLDSRVRVEGQDLGTWLFNHVMPPLPAVAKPQITGFADELPSRAPRHLRAPDGDTPALRFMRTVRYMDTAGAKRLLRNVQRRERHAAKATLAALAIPPLPRVA